MGLGAPVICSSCITLSVGWGLPDSTRLGCELPRICYGVGCAASAGLHVWGRFKVI